MIRQGKDQSLIGKRLTSVLSLLIVVSLMTGCASLRPGVEKNTTTDRLAETIDTELILPLEAMGASVGVMVSDTNGVVLYSHDATRLFLPASIQKLMVTADAMVHLPQEYRWQTNIELAGQLDSTGCFHGDIYLRGAWDPTLSDNQPYTGWPWGPFDQVADQIAQLGVDRFDGTLVAEGRIFIPNGWEAADLGASYAPAISELTWNDGLLTSFAGLVGDSLMWDIWPDPIFWSEDHSASRLWPSASNQTSSALAPPENHPLWPGMNDFDMVAARDPRLLAADALRTAIIHRGLTPPDSVVALDSLTWEPQMPFAVLTHESAPLDTVLKAMLAVSSNAWAEQIQATVTEQLGENPLGRPHWPAVLDSLQIPARGLRATDACGMSRKNNLAPATMQDLLLIAWREWGNRWVDLLPRADQSRTSLVQRMEGYGDLIAAKTGSMSRCRSLAGYILKDGEPVVAFTIIVNNAPLNPTDFLDDTVMRLADILVGQPNAGGLDHAVRTLR